MGQGFMKDQQEIFCCETWKVRSDDSDDVVTSFPVNIFNQNDCLNNTPDCFYKVLKLSLLQPKHCNALT